MPSILPGRMLAVLVQVLFAARWSLRCAPRRFPLRCLAAAPSWRARYLIGIVNLAGVASALAAGAASWSWLTGASLARPVLLAAAVAGTAGSAPWLIRPWPRWAWIVLWLTAGVRPVTGTASPVEMVRLPAARQLKPRSAGTRMVREGPSGHAVYR